jgi:galactonate dehydratase
MLPNFIIAEYILPFAEYGRKICTQLEPHNGYIELSDAPGLGVEINEQALPTYAYKEFDKRHIRTYDEEGP